jgi:hypothetical protein
MSGLNRIKKKKKVDSNLPSPRKSRIMSRCTINRRVAAATSEQNPAFESDLFEAKEDVHDYIRVAIWAR